MRTSPGKPFFLETNNDFNDFNDEKDDCNNKIKEYLIEMLRQYSPKRLNSIMDSYQQGKYNQHKNKTNYKWD